MNVAVVFVIGWYVDRCVAGPVYVGICSGIGVDMIVMILSRSMAMVDMMLMSTLVVMFMNVYVDVGECGCIYAVRVRIC